MHFALSLSQDIASGLYAFERMAHGRQWPVVKGQTTGPVTCGVQVINFDA